MKGEDAMRRKWRSVLSFILAFTVLTGSFLLLPLQPAKAATTKWGFHVESDGTLTLGGKAFYGVGMNMWDGFNRTIHNPLYQEYAPSFKVLADNKIPFIRVAFSGYYANDLKEYRDDPNTYFANMDKFVKTAESYHIGIIASLFWAYYSVPDLVGEKVSKIGDPNSKSSEYIRKYVRDVVTRYKDSPAIWGWEVGNENNNACDIGYAPPVAVNEGTPTSRSTQDFVTSTDINVYANVVASEIRKLDTYRMISNGDAEYRNAQYNLSKNGSWQQDTLDQMKTIVGVFSPGGIDTVSVHIYEYDQSRYGRTVGIEEMLKDFSDAAKSYKKVLYFGEFGAKTDAIMVRLVNAIKSSGIQLSSPWNFDEVGMGHDSFSNVGAGSYCFTRSVELNQYYRSKGLQNTDVLWSLINPSPTNQNTTSKSPTSSAAQQQSSSKPGKTTSTAGSASGTTGSSTAGTTSETGSAATTTTGGLNILSKNTDEMLVDNQNKIVYIVPDMTFQKFKDALQTDGEYTYQVFDASGKEVKNSKDTLKESFHVKVYQSGAEISDYVIKIGSHTDTESNGSNVWLILLIVFLVLASGAVTVFILVKKGVLKWDFLSKFIKGKK